MFALHETAVLDCSHDGLLAVSWGKFTAFVLLPRLLEEHDAVVVHQVFQKLLLLHLEQEPPFIF